MERYSYSIAPSRNIAHFENTDMAEEYAVCYTGWVINTIIDGRVIVSQWFCPLYNYEDILNYLRYYNIFELCDEVDIEFYKGLDYLKAKKYCEQRGVGLELIIEELMNLEDCSMGDVSSMTYEPSLYN